MIPNHIESTWKEGLKSKDYFLKLCGSGGGGYIIGFSFDLLKANNQLKGYNFQVLISY